MSAPALARVELVERAEGGCALVLVRPGEPPVTAPLTVDDALDLARQLLDGTAP